jgi:hypothetical protein
MDLTSIKGAIDGVGYIRSALGVLLNEKIEMTVRERVLDVLSRVDSIQSALFDAREDSHKVQVERNELERKLREIEDWNQTQAKYRFLVAPCFAQRTVVPLQESMPGVFNCPNAKCKAQFIMAAVDRPVVVSDFDPRDPCARWTTVFKRRPAQSKNFCSKVFDISARFIHLSQHQTVGAGSRS